MPKQKGEIIKEKGPWLKNESGRWRKWNLQHVKGMFPNPRREKNNESKN